jgi:hypothetical protein
MKIVLINDQGQSIASVNHIVRAGDPNSIQAFALLDLIERLLESAVAEGGKQPAAATAKIEAT